MTTTEAPLSVDKPRSSARPAARRSNFELYSWIFMRLSGVVLLFLVLGHMLIMLFLEGGVHRIDFAFVAGRWASPFWQVWDLLMLWLAGLHGGNGLRTVINDYSRSDHTRFWLKMLLYCSIVLTVVLGTYVLFTFDPSIS
ncbi:MULTISPECIES: succinate dehydrogenase hydrophobic membrane anchor subunit [Actinopolyspora]|uniref:Succinate dehydrogenase / fumarate reductase membrane anchor subunit n=1 Tax=Actinopolyspora saharensis TaxID=995062 RepID=A0A1H1GSP5_9ACTN|nr:MULTISPECIES: succinate dehydrogenase hydrophobic membrane anchor subunit [Actinopolyspora]NHD16770.1 succinate dehydrogenase hydrophobic membrane anchor subunit [Actinopolyspora sp. BKK2]NHE75367.1 succinate dehydrogenase hydrophobic membrane anchor subunit [Actinopolyspora sp. BKK1]SDR16169.1 succinate dehydrogenase / fumarate reductase membrane anchor subunit [Actinopolyspora saharensis]